MYFARKWHGETAQVTMSIIHGTHSIADRLPVSVDADVGCNQACLYIWKRKPHAPLPYEACDSLWQLSVTQKYRSITHIIRHKMETFVALLALCAGNSPVTGEFPLNSPHKGQWRGALMFSLIWCWTNDWVNSRDAGDLGRHSAHYDVMVMILSNVFYTNANLSAGAGFICS